MYYYVYARSDEFHCDKQDIQDKYGMAFQHYHDTYELIFITGGERYVCYNNVIEKVSKGDLVIFPPYVLHATQTCGNEIYSRYNMSFSHSAISEIMNRAEADRLFDGLHTCIIHFDGVHYEFIRHAFETMLDSTQGRDEYERKLHASKLIVFINSIKRMSKAIKPSDKPDRVCSERFADILNFINSHYTEPITLDTAAEHAHLNKSHFCRLFKKELGISFSKHLANLRTAHAHALLVETDLPIQTIADMSGFSSLLHLERTVKSIHGKSPSEIRKDNTDKRKPMEN